MIQKAKVTEDEFIMSYLRLWNGGIGLTQKELDILFFFLKRKRKLERDGVPTPYIKNMLFNTETVNDMKKALKMSNSNWGNYKAKLMEKKILIEKDDFLFIHQMLIPREKITIEFEIIEKQES
jgi:hypothetical protein